VALANGSDYGLTASIQSADTARATAVANRLKSGSVHINDLTALATAWAPLPGWGASGNGTAFGGASDFDAYTQCQWTTVTAG
jgi:benzaldehyde dehydrogenase (NAD)